MNDRFRFRAKALEDTPSISVKKGKFVYGYYRPENKQDEDCSSGRDVHLISMQYGDHWVDVEIDFATLGQCTGLKDENGKLIYEGDIVRVAQLSTNLPVVYDLKFATFELLSYKYCVSLHGSDENLEVIGNIHEHGGLLNEN